MTTNRKLAWDWFDGVIPANVEVGDSSYIETTYSFQMLRSRAPDAVRIGRGASIYLGVMFDLGPSARMRIGDYSLVNSARFICDSEIAIGDYCLISWNVVIMDSYRSPIEPELRRKRFQEGRPVPVPESPPAPVHIGNNVWIGFGCCILPGVSIGEGSVIGASSVVNADVPAYCIAAGNPARVLRKISKDGAIEHT